MKADVKNQKAEKQSAEVVIADVKGIEITSTDAVTLASQIAEAEQGLEAACFDYHKSVIDSYIAIGKAVLKLRAIVDANLANLGNYSSFKAWMADKTFGSRKIGYKQCTLYATIGKNSDVARDLYNSDESCWTLSALASAVNEATGNTKSGGRKTAEKTASESESAEAVEAKEAAVSTTPTTTEVSPLEFVLAFIGAADLTQIGILNEAIALRISTLSAK